VIGNLLLITLRFAWNKTMHEALPQLDIVQLPLLLIAMCISSLSSDK
jgi:hypothetical protein